MMGDRIVVADKETVGSALKRFKRAIERNGVSWDMRRRRLLVQPGEVFTRSTEERRAKKFQKRSKAREATLLAKIAGEQPGSASASELNRAFWKKTGKP
jgi:ribosomal protein S21